MNHGIPLAMLGRQPIYSPEQALRNMAATAPPMSPHSCFRPEVVDAMNHPSEATDAVSLSAAAKCLMSAGPPMMPMSQMPLR